MALYGEVGVVPVEQEIYKRQLRYLRSLLTTDKFASNIFMLQIAHMQPKSWWVSVNNLLTRYDLLSSIALIVSMKKEACKICVKKGVEKYFNKWYHHEAVTKPKMTDIQPHKQNPDILFFKCFMSSCL